MTKTATLGVMTAIPEEIEDLGAAFTEEGREVVAGLVFRRGVLEGRRCVLVETGIGKVNAAIVATLLISRFGCGGLVFSGVAGGLDPALGVGDVVIATRLIAHDYGALIDGDIRPYQPGVPPLPGFDETVGYDIDAEVLNRLRPVLDGIALPTLSSEAAGGEPRTPRLHFGTVLTGDTFMNCGATRERLFNRFGGLAVEMEGAAVAQTAARFTVPLVVIRALSDLAGADSHVDFGAFVHETAAVAAGIVRQVVGHL